MNAETGNAVLIEFIRHAIKERGPVSFAWFMEQALYHPEHGYYASDQCVIGRRGDYFTNVAVGPIFGRLLARQFAEIWERLGKPDGFVVAEQGAHHGEFARDVLESIRQNTPAFFAAVRYRLIEPFSILRERQAATLRDFDNQVEWERSVEEVAPFTGIYFGNELFDALPVHLLVSRPAKSSGWLEKFVGWEVDKFVFVERPPATAELAEHIKILPHRPNGYETEIRLRALNLVDAIARRLVRGFFLTFDYGFSREEFYAEHRTSGTLQCRSQHRLLASPLDRVGRCDITAHVEWTSLMARAEAAVFSLAGLTDQHHFLTGILAGAPGLVEKFSGKERRGLKTLLHPEMLGRSFQVLGLSRGCEQLEVLSGFKFARENEALLDL